MDVTKTTRALAAAPILLACTMAAACSPAANQPADPDTAVGSVSVNADGPDLTVVPVQVLDGNVLWVADSPKPVELPDSLGAQHRTMSVSRMYCGPDGLLALTTHGDAAIVGLGNPALNKPAKLVFGDGTTAQSPTLRGSFHNPFGGNFAAVQDGAVVGLSDGRGHLRSGAEVAAFVRATAHAKPQKVCPRG